MEPRKIEQLAKNLQAGQNLPTFATSTSVVAKDSDGDFSMSLYSGNLTPEVAIKNVAKVKASFPALPQAFFDILLERVKAKGFSNERLTDAVNHVIDTCQYPTPTLASFLSFDRRIKMITYAELCNKVDKGESFDSYARIKVAGMAFYVTKADKVLHNIPDEI